MERLHRTSNNPIFAVIPAKAGTQCRCTSRTRSHWVTRFARPFGAILWMFCALRACPAFAGMTAIRRLFETQDGGVDPSGPGGPQPGKTEPEAYRAVGLIVSGRLKSLVGFHCGKRVSPESLLPTM